MALSGIQQDLLVHLLNALENSAVGKFVYHTEWLGYLPFGLYHWITVDGEDISRTIPTDWALDWSSQDLTALEQAGYIETTSKWENPDDDCETATTFRLKTNDQHSA
jgi:hypothetical protein